jgi:hypothetical protein
VPLAGLNHVLRTWVGRGQLVKVLNQLAAEELPRDWRPEDTQMRADLMLFLDLVPLVERLPDSPRSWIDILPAQSRRRILVGESPTGATSWVETRRRYGWPPSAFVIKRRDRVAHELLASALSWVGSEVLRLARIASSIDPASTVPVVAQLRSLSAAFEAGLIETGAEEPRPSELAAVEREGVMWRRLVDVARRIRAASAPELAAELLWPVAELRPTLFHLGVLGDLLLALNATGASIVSKSPLSVGTGREHFHIEYCGRNWHLWMEAGSAWRRYGVQSQYRTLVSALQTQTRSLSPDLMLVLPGEAAFIIECKYSANADYVGRTGLAQTLLYMADVGSEIAPVVEGVVVAPDGVVSDSRWVSTTAGGLGIATSAVGTGRAAEFFVGAT